MNKIQIELQEVANVDVPLLKISNLIEIKQLEQHILIQELLEFSRQEKRNDQEFNKLRKEILDKQLKLNQNFKEGIKLSEQGLKTSSEEIFQEIHQSLLILLQENNLLNQEIEGLFKAIKLEKTINQNTIDQILKKNTILENQEHILINRIDLLTEKQLKITRIHQSRSLIINIILGFIVIFVNVSLILIILKKVNLNFIYFSEQIKKAKQSIQSGKDFELNQENVDLSDEFNNLTNNFKKMVNNILVTQKTYDEIQERLETLATTDALTGAFNVRKWKEMLNYEIDKTYRTGDNLSIVLFDIDFFKRINDTYGHQVGDQVLCKLVMIIQKVIRKIDSLYRIGGEEFFILCPNSDYNQAMILAERIRKVVESTNFEQVNQVTISLGITQLKKSDNSLKFVKRADQALYESKRNGRNQAQYK